MENVLIIKRISDNRIVDIRTNASLIEVPDTDSSNWDSSSYDWIAGIQNYEDSDIWDSSTGLLTDAACAVLGLDTSLKSKVLKDVAISVPLGATEYPDDYTCVVSGSTVTITQSLLSADSRNRHYRITMFNLLGGMSEDGTDAIFGLPRYSYPVEGTGHIIFKVELLDADDVLVTDEDHDFNFYTTAGTFQSSRVGTLSSGVEYFTLYPPAQSISITVSAITKAASNVAPGQFQFLLGEETP